jgi:hypothetical protein
VGYENKQVGYQLLPSRFTPSPPLPWVRDAEYMKVKRAPACNSCGFGRNLGHAPIPLATDIADVTILLTLVI